MAMDSELGGEVEIADPEPEGPKHNILPDEQHGYTWYVMLLRGRWW
jgi:hypothetical protein